MASGPITSQQIDGETVETVTDFNLEGSKITADGKIPVHNPFWSTAHNPFWNAEGLFSEKKLFQVALGPGDQDNWNSVGEMLPPAGES